MTIAAGSNALASEQLEIHNADGTLRTGLSAIATDAIWDAAGDIAQGTGANTAARLAIGTANQVPRVNAGATALEYASQGRQVFISEATASASANISFTGLSSTYRYYLLVLRNIKPATDNTDLYLTMSTDNGASYLAGTGYLYHLAAPTSSAATYAGAASNGAAFIRLGAGSGNSAIEAISGWVGLWNMPSTVNRKHITSFLNTCEASGAVGMLVTVGTNTTTSAVDAVRLAFNTGNIASGTVALYGVL